MPNQRETGSRLDQAASKAFDLVQEFAEVEDPYSDEEDNPWRNPGQMYKALDDARLELNQAWMDHQQQIISSKSPQEAEEQKEKTNKSNDPNEKDLEEFRAVYMDMITDAFADVLDSMREEDGSSIDIEVLVDCLQSGIDLVTSEERDDFFQALEGGDNENDYLEESGNDDSAPSQHELHQMQVGLDVHVAG